VNEPRGRLARLETTKDTVQVFVESGATHAGRIAVIVAGAVAGVTRELGEWATDVFEIREAARRARARADLEDDAVTRVSAGSGPGRST
jgi:hypothetical protein